MAIPTQKYYQDRKPPYAARVFLENYGDLDPMALPWNQLRARPEDFPEWDIAKVSSARTVIGMDYEVSRGVTKRIYIKRSLIHGRLKQILSHFRSSKEWREFQHAKEFDNAGINVPTPLYYSEGTGEDGIPVVFYVTRGINPEFEATKKYFNEVRRFAEGWHSLARFTQYLHAKNIIHGDYRADHIYYNKSADVGGDPNCWALIDLDGSRVGWFPSTHDRFRALTQLVESLHTSGIEREHVADFLRIYDPKQSFKLDADKIYDYTLDKVNRRQIVATLPN